MLVDSSLVEEAKGILYIYQSAKKEKKEKRYVAEGLRLFGQALKVCSKNNFYILHKYNHLALCILLGEVADVLNSFELWIWHEWNFVNRVRIIW